MLLQVSETHQENRIDQSQAAVASLERYIPQVPEISELPPMGRQQEYFAFGEGSKLFLESTDQDRSLQKWGWICGGLALTGMCILAIAVWQFAPVA